MEVGLFVLGILVGVGLTWYLLERYQRDEAAAREASFNARAAALQAELGESDAALAETKERLIALQMEQRTGETRSKSLAAEAAQAKRAAEQAVEQEMRQRQLVTQLQGELAGLRRETAAETAPAPPPALPTKPTAKTADDLTEIKGIGKVIEKKLHEMGITSFRQIAAMTPEDAHRVNEAIEFPGRVERENWIEQARTLSRG